MVKGQMEVFFNQEVSISLSGISFFSDLEGAELTMAVNRPTEIEYEKILNFLSSTVKYAGTFHLEGTLYSKEVQFYIFCL